MQAKLPNHKHSRSNLFTKVADAVGAVHTIKGIYDAGRMLYNVGQAAAPYVAAMGAMV